MQLMQELVGIAFMATVLVGLPTFCTWLVVKGIRTGVVRAKGSPYYRAESPVFFWLTIAVYAALALWVGHYAVLIGIDLLNNP